MLKHLHITNYALIDALDIDFDNGFSVITGETGAGKSIIIGALSLVVGLRADTKAIKTGEEKCVIEANFDISAYNLKAFFEENSLDFDENSCTIRREITSQGKSRAFINDTPAALNTVRELTAQLLDIHSQHENLLLTKLDYQREVLDNFAGNAQILTDYQNAFFEWKKLVAESEKLKVLAAKQLADFEYKKFQYQQLTDFKLQNGEQEELEQELETLTHAEEIKTELLHAENLISEDEKSCIILLKDSILSLRKIQNYIENGSDLYNRLETAQIEIKDIATEIAALQEKIEYSPERQNIVETRLSEMYTLQKKFALKTVAELLEKQHILERELRQIENFDEEILKSEKATAAAFEKLKNDAEKLTVSRQSVSKTLEKQLINELLALGMQSAQIEIDITPLSDFTVEGKDEISILFSANKNREPQQIAQIASGGELSRIMLAIKLLLSNKATLPTIIFDEIDTGISGETAYRMGEIMKKMSQTMQVFAITHLPQIAARGDGHFRVFKTENNSKTTTYIEHLSIEERVREIAQMLSGNAITDAALANAKELLEIKKI